MYHLPDQSEKSREPENENGDRSWQTGSREVGLVITSGLQRTWGQFLTLRTSSAWRRGLTPGSNSSRISSYRPAGTCPASSWWRATGGPRCWCWPPPWSRRTWGCSGWPRHPRLQLAHPRQGRRLLTTSDCWARPRCEAATCSSEKWRSMFS